MIIRFALLIAVLICSLATISLSQDQSTIGNPPSLTFTDLQTGERAEAPFRIEGFVIDISKCPPCPPGAVCKPCLGDHLVATDRLDDKDPLRRLRIFTANPDQFAINKSYVFTVKVRGRKQPGRAIDQVDLLGFAESGTSIAATPEITAANWRQHPQVKLVRTIVGAINGEMAKGVFKTSERKFSYCEPYEDTLRKLTVDAKGIVRRYETQGGSDDSSLTTDHYYDASGRLRFVFISGGAVNGSVLEHRIYFDEAGKRIWEEHKYLKGPGYTFPEVWPDDELRMAEPAKAFAASSPCPADKTKTRQ